MASMTINKAEFRNCLIETLPTVLEENHEIQYEIFRISRCRFADADETHLRFERMFEELRQGRELAEKRWQESQEKFAETQRESRERWEKNQEELATMRLEFREHCNESQQKFETMQRESHERWKKNQEELAAMRLEFREHCNESQQKFETMQRESRERWEKNQAELEAMRHSSDERFERLLNEIKQQRNKHESSIGALGARWGLAAESSFRNGLKELLEQDFGVEVLNITEYDDNGDVFGHPDQIELDIIINNGTLIICEIKSSVSRSEMYTFYRKVQFYEKRHQRNATKLMVISPMIDQRARSVADKLGITVHSYADDVQL
ncbi:hypothetical protein CSB45_13980 [candidate division KSB3 bacterium]|uniref:DUF3782 domain-containing protein n=1 Tax=candidate division KSB3 bacterium TaxID=2044937 RepID=A0A2G6E1Z5_9BACT|nr:MAG: hypothetical protein CSB45_13980 [candidate division KSB3 bacterium]